jgi:hypothetical protein
MSGNNQQLPNWTQAQIDMQGEVSPRKDSALHRFLGGSPGAVFLRLLFVSLIVGAFLFWLDIEPRDIVNGLINLAHHIYGLGFEAVRELFGYIAAGAVIVLPIWLILRLLNMRGAR